MKYMVAFASASPLCERVKLRLADETPLSVECTPPAPLPPCASPALTHASSADSFNTSESDDAGFMKFFLAPKIEEGED